jgi:hypothetical protein
VNVSHSIPSDNDVTDSAEDEEATPEADSRKVKQVRSLGRPIEVMMKGQYIRENDWNEAAVTMDVGRMPETARRPRDVAIPLENAHEILQRSAQSFGLVASPSTCLSTCRLKMGTKWKSR